jgi:ABC-type multidrug transport system fused ATPase/permease subunit
MAKRKKEKTKYTMMSNIAYAFKKNWKWDKIYILTYIPIPPLDILTSLIMIFIPRMIINGIEENHPIMQITLTIIILFACLFIIQQMLMYCKYIMYSRYFVTLRRFELELSEKEMTTDFANTDNPKARNKRDLAFGHFWSTDSLFANISSFMSGILGVFTYSAIIITLSPIILAVIVVSTLINYFMSKNQIKYIDRHKYINSERDRKKGQISLYAREFEYAKDVKLYGMTGWINDMLNKFKLESLKWEKKLTSRNFEINAVNALLTFIRDGTVYIILIYMLLNNQITLGDFAFYFGAIVGFSGWLGGISEAFNEMIRNSMAIGYCREYLEIKDVYNHGKGCELPKDLPLEIEIKNVSYKYAGAENFTLKNINLKIKKGEKLAIVGENGAGKTTLVKLLCGYYYPTEGEIYVNGKSLLEYNLEEYYTMFAAVFQDIGLLPVTIEEFVASRNADSNEINGDRVNQVIQKAELGNKIACLSNGVKTKLMKSVYDDAIDLSGGEKQKLMLARALYKNAPCIILDEPTAALDPIAESNLYEKYNELTQNKTSVYISHRLASTRFCDRIVYVENGGIAEQGTHDELMQSSGRYANMFDLQSHYYKETPDNTELKEGNQNG